MSWEPSVHAEHFLVALFKRRAGQERAARQIIGALEQGIRDYGGKIQLRSDRPANWSILDGKQHFVEPDHLNPAIFDFDTIMVGAFKTSERVHTWWNSDEVFELMKFREPIEKMGLFTVDGLIEAFDLESKQRMSFGDKLMLIEFIKLDAFRPMQHYVDSYKRFAAQAQKDIGTPCNLLFAEGISSVLMSEFPVEACCASSWRTRSDVISWYEANNYQKELMPLRYDYAKCFTIIVPIFEDKLDEYEKAKKPSVAAGSKLKALKV
eukprot:gb/GFBE01045359.1/.p1 GENE.gb/GFBE01045359.1/~~gb/GFBE01045359.1/.p1  ORF type:complete len:265 (+),score=59.22 gb/GFBE01045359.1/:1-795(+)